MRETGRDRSASKLRPWVLRLARPYIRRRLRRALDGVYVEGAERMAALAASQPVVVAANHVCWWDALTILALDEHLELRSHCVMDADNLRRLPFFGWVGAVPLDRSSPRRALTDMRSASTLVAPGSALWIFPQGKQRPAHVRPLGLHAGVRWLAKKANAQIVPLSLNYLFREAPTPTVTASFGKPLCPEGPQLMTNLEDALAEGLERCDRFVLSGAGAFKALVAPQQESNVPVAGRLIAGLSSPRRPVSARRGTEVEGATHG